jgi:hypothetical protein
LKPGYGNDETANPKEVLIVHPEIFWPLQSFYPASSHFTDI